MGLTRKVASIGTLGLVNWRDAEQRTAHNSKLLLAEQQRSNSVIEAALTDGRHTSPAPVWLLVIRNPKKRKVHVMVMAKTEDEWARFLKTQPAVANGVTREEHVFTDRSVAELREELGQAMKTKVGGVMGGSVPLGSAGEEGLHSFLDEVYGKRAAIATAATGEVDSAATPTGDLVGQLERLASLHDEGALTDAEFAAAKAGLLKTP